MFGFKKKNVGIDLGTSNILIYLQGSGIVINEPSFIAQSSSTGELKAVGSAAELMFEKNPPTISVIRPIRRGVISNFKAAVNLLKYFLNFVYNNKIGNAFSIMSISNSATEVESRAIKDVAISGGISEAYTVDKTVAAALGAGLPAYDAPGTMVVDLGAGTVDISTISLGKANASQTTIFAGDAMDEAIKNMVLQRYNFRISKKDAKILKEKLGSADIRLAKELGFATVKGIDLISNLPIKKEISAEDVSLAIASPVSHILSSIQDTLEETLPELVSDIIDRGITLTGGGANLHSLDKVIANTIHVPVTIASNPAETVANGLGEMLHSSQLQTK